MWSRIKLRLMLSGLTVTLESSDDLKLREEAARALGRLGDARAIKPLMAALTLKDDESSVRRAATDALIEMGTIAVDPLVAALKNNNTSVRFSAWHALAEIGDVRAIEPLIETFKNEQDPGLQQDVGRALLKISRDTRAIEPLKAALGDPDFDAHRVRRVVMEALRQIDPDWSKSEAAKKVTLDRTTEVELSMAAQAPEQIDSTSRNAFEIAHSYGIGDGAPLLVEADPDLKGIFTNPNPPVPQKPTDRNRDYWKHGSLEEKRTALAVAYLQHPNSEVRIATLDFVRDIGAARVSQVLVDLLGDKDIAVRTAAAKAIWERQRENNCKYAVSMLKDEMQYPGSILGRDKAEQALDLLVQQAPDSQAKDAIMVWINDQQ